jgi:uncharacterized protein (DUF433 family)
MQRQVKPKMNGKIIVLNTESRRAGPFKMRTVTNDERLEIPMYGLSEAALYLRVPVKTLEYWIFGKGSIKPLIQAAGQHPRSLSFMNLLECHMLAAMKKIYNLKLPKIRRALADLNSHNEFKHPLIEQPLFTNRIDLLLKDLDHIVNISRKNKQGQYEIPEIVSVHLERVEWDKETFKFYPFVRERSAQEPKYILISPKVGFGKPVIAGTGISTAVIASRFNARESMPDLAQEYGLTEEQIEEAIRWETRAVAA